MKIKYKSSGERIDVFLSRNIKKLSRNEIQFLIKNNFVTVNSKKVKQNYFLKYLDEIYLEFNELNSQNKLEKWNKNELIEVIFENNDYLIINKPSGLTVHPGAGNENKTLVNILINMNVKLSNIHSNRPGIVHRLDKDTTGVMIIAKTNEFHKYIQNQFEERKVKKKYHALVEGNLNNSIGIIEAPIGRSDKDRKKMIVTNKNSKQAITKFKIIKRFNKNDLVEFNILTGRTHQIRVHSLFINHPIVNDPIYGKNDESDSFNQYLHSYELSFLDKDSKLKKYHCDIPEEFQKKLKMLKRYN